MSVPAPDLVDIGSCLLPCSDGDVTSADARLMRITVRSLKEVMALKVVMALEVITVSWSLLLLLLHTLLHTCLRTFLHACLRHMFCTQ